MSDGTSDRDLRGSDGPGVLGRWPAAAEPASAPGVTIEPAEWPDADQPLIGYVAGGTIFPPLAGPLGQLTVTQDANGETIRQVVDFDRAVRDSKASKARKSPAAPKAQAPAVAPVDAALAAVAALSPADRAVVRAALVTGSLAD